MKDVLILFAKYPKSGDVKTRLASEIGPHAAAQIYRQFIQHLAKKLSNPKIADKIIFAVAQPEFLQQFADEFSGADDYIAQIQSANLGKRIQAAFSYGFARGAEKVVMIGTDSPSLPAGYIRNAFHALNSVDVVIGPAEDGGYYLIGARKLHTELFENISWSTSEVLRQSLQSIRNLALSYHLLDPCFDVDELQDLKKLARLSPEIFSDSAIAKLLDRVIQK